MSKSNDYVAAVFLPWLPTYWLGHAVQGTIQLILWAVAAFMMWTVIGLVIGIPLHLLLVVWSWIVIARTPVRVAAKK